jgi:hypothetical protein
MTAFRWIAKDSNDKIWLFEKKPKYDQENNCWWADKGEELFDLDKHHIPNKTHKYINNQFRRIKDYKKSLLKLDPETWLILGE